MTEIAITSFFPTKPLGCYGDGGAVFTSSKSYADTIRMLLNNGQTERNRHKTVGINGRLDTLQAAILRVKLRHFDEELKMRQEVAGWYSEALDGLVGIPKVEQWNYSSWAQYTLRSQNRDQIIGHLHKSGVPTAIHYPIPLHRQEAFACLDVGDNDLPIANSVSGEVFSLPMHPFLEKRDVLKITEIVKGASF